MASKGADSQTFAKLFDKAKKRKRSDAASKPIDETNKPPKKKKQRPPKKKKVENNNERSSSNSSGKKVLSREALDLSSQLKECSKNKNLTEALSLYWDSRHDKIRDQFHASITIDCCARCGALEEITRILKSLKEPASVETNTGAIKGYSHGGDIPRAFQLFESMFQRKAKLHPNIRTLNTLLRGCLWTAATVKGQDQICGGVVTAEKAWNLYNEKETSIPNTSPPSYEYTISLLCQALQTERAEERIQQFQKMCEIKTKKDSVKGGDQDSLETLAVSYSALARAKALLGDKKGALDACNLARCAMKASRQRQSNTELQSTTTGGRPAVGGTKRGWKDNNDERRTVSNTMFRDHRISELEINLQALVAVCQSETFPPGKDVLATRIVNGLFYFSGGGTTSQKKDDSQPAGEDDNNKPNKMHSRQLRRQVANSSWFSFGLQAAVALSGLVDASFPNDFLRVKDSERLFREVGKTPKAIQDDGYMDFSSIFPETAATKGIDIELGSGYGEWIVNQASSKPDRAHVAVELRADRVHQIFAKGMLHPQGPLPNLAVVGDNGASFLQERVQPKSISTIFANHPEPPTQVQGKSDRDLQAIMEGGPEPAHMLCSTTLISAGKVLQDEQSSAEGRKGRIVIVTDNRNYARLLCATVVRIHRQQKSSSSVLLQSCSLKAKSLGLKEVESFQLNDGPESKKSGRVVLLEGQPSSKIGHAVSQDGDVGNKKGNKGSSYFDRLWRTGACGHASHRERYILVLERVE